MTDYNDGKWHGWNGGECPVHPKSVVKCAYSDDRKALQGLAKSFPWNSPIYSHGGTDRPVAFSVVKAYREPREFWVTLNDNYAHETLESALSDSLTEKHGFIHVREVRDDA